MLNLENPNVLQPSNYEKHIYRKIELKFTGYTPITLHVRLHRDVGLQWLTIEKIDHEFEKYIDVTISCDEEGLDLPKIQMEQLEKLKPYLNRLPRKNDGWKSLEKLFTIKG